MPRLIALLALTGAALLSGGALADSGSKAFGDYTVYYAALRSDELTPEIAQRYGVTRAPNRAVVLINLQKHGAMAAAAVRGRARNLLGHEQPLTFRESRHENAIDYLAEVAVQNRTIVVFDVHVQPDGASTPFFLQFRRTFYTD